MTSTTSGIERAIAAAGSESLLAEQLDITQQAVNKMKQRGWCSLARARQINRRYPSIAVRDLIDPEIAALSEEN